MTVGGQQFDLELVPYGNELRRRWKILFPKPPATLPKQDGTPRPLLQRIVAPGPPLQRPAAPR
jgi:hypothetical protein